jgi:hypothetical protein
MTSKARESATKETDRLVISEDLAVIDQAIADHEKFQTSLYVMRRILGEVGKVDAKRADLNRGVEAEQIRLDNARVAADAAEQRLSQLTQQVESKQRELAAVEVTIQERNVVLNDLNQGYLNLRRMLEAA